MGSLSSALEVRRGEVVSFIGGGGKTTAMFMLAGELAAHERVLVTTTTKIFYPQEVPAVCAGSLQQAKSVLRGFTGAVVLARERHGGKLHGIPPHWVEALKEDYPYILVEADGAGRRPLKGYADHEPVIPASSDTVAAVTGMTAKGVPLDNEYVHRPERLSAAAGYPCGAPVVPWVIARANQEMARRIKEQAPDAKSIAILNQVQPHQREQYFSLGRFLAAQCFDKVLLGCLQPRTELVRICGGERVQVGAVILAAGTSTRMGDRNKLLLPVGGVPMIRRVAENTLQAVGEENVVVVLGHQAERIKAVLKDLPVRFAVNEHYQRGQAGSVAAGIGVLAGKWSGAMFVLGDQPQLPPQLLASLITAFQVETPPAVYPTFNNKRGNPVIFRSDYFPQLLQLTGDRGGRELLKQLGPQALAVPTVYEQILKDIDTVDDWQSTQNS